MQQILFDFLKDSILQVYEIWKLFSKNIGWYKQDWQNYLLSDFVRSYISISFENFANLYFFYTLHDHLVSLSTNSGKLIAKNL